ncbi:MAG: hypothetical protein ACREFP_04510, partial [Acetobacteraceae bacterium]
MTAAPQVSGAEQDAIALGRLAADCRLAGVERQVLLLRLSLLPPEHYRPHHGRLAEGALEPLSSADRARFYRLPGNDLALAWRGGAARQESRVLATLAVLFAESEPPLPGFAELVRRFTVPRDAEWLAACLAQPEAAAPHEPARPPPDLAVLGAVERALASADVSRFARRRSVARRESSGVLRLAWEKRLLSVAEIGESLAPEHDLIADPWLFRRLSRTLDRRLLALLSAPHELAQALPFAVALNVESVLSPAFLGFDAALPPGLRGNIVLDLLPADVLQDAAAFMFARDFARARGYRLALSAVPPSLLPMLSVTALGLDFLEVGYSPALASLPVSLLDDAAGERARILLTGVDSPAALLWGEAQGCVLFEGRAAVPGSVLPLS